jgi:hypothetical protein
MLKNSYLSAVGGFPSIRRLVVLTIILIGRPAFGLMAAPAVILPGEATSPLIPQDFVNLVSGHFSTT